MIKILSGIDMPFRPSSGSFICCNDWYSDLPEDVAVRFLTLASGDPYPWWSIKDVVMMDIENPLTSDAFFSYVQDLKRVLLPLITEYRPDVIHCQQLNYGFSRAIAELGLSIPTIGICHGTDVQIAHDQEFYLHNLEVICEAMDLLVFPNNNMKDDFFKLYKRPVRYAINPLGIPNTFFSHHPAVRTFCQEGLKVLYAGRLTSSKGVDIVIEALNYTRQPVHLTLIGREDETGFLNRMKHLIHDSGLEGSVHHVPHLSRSALQKQFHAYDVIVFPTRMIESFSLTAVEAQASGLPVAFYGSSGIVNTLGKSAYRIRQNTPQAWAAAFDYLAATPEALSKLAEKGFANAQKYRLSVSKSNLIALSRTLLERNMRTPL